MRAVCIDFETANSFIGSACSVGIAVIEEKKIIDKRIRCSCRNAAWKTVRWGI
ncbi:MAG: hypothetical protein P4L59_11485 [Desulfosporosinus sp.]|nr:hypothetical protein [Desulfosporosinus sp.]